MDFSEVRERSAAREASGAERERATTGSPLQRLLDAALTITGATSGSVMLLDTEAARLSVAAARGLDDRIVRNARPKLGASVAGWVAATGEPLLLGDPHAMPIPRSPGREDVGSSLCLPVRGRGQILGVLNLNRGGQTRQFSEEDLQRGLVLAAVASTLIELTRHADQLQEARRQVERFRLELINAREDERRRIARELHDNALQSLADFIWQLTACKRLLTVDPPRVRGELRRLTRSLRSTIKEIREICQDLRPTILEEGLLPALQAYVAEFARRTGVAASLQWTGDQPRLRPEVESSLFRIIQEALNNVRKHARARKVRVHIAVRGGRLRVRVADDGVGFDPRVLSRASSRGLGVANIRDRAQLLGGECMVTTAPGQGTRVSVGIPLDAASPSAPAPRPGQPEGPQ